LANGSTTIDKDRHGGRNGGVGVGLLPYRADKTDALADDCADQPLPVASVADRVTGGVDPAEQRRFRHDPPAPDRSQQIVLADDPIAVAH
jgi:hypothetical protein